MCIKIKLFKGKNPTTPALLCDKMNNKSVAFGC